MLNNQLFPPGIYAALTTPFKEDGMTVDYEAIPDLVTALQEQGVAGFYVCGTTGQWKHLTKEDRKKIFEIVNETVEKSGKGTALIAHVGSHSLEDTIELGIHAKEHGALAVSAITPAKKDITQEEIINYYKELAGKINHPFIMYMFPNLTGVELDYETISRLAEVNNVVGIKFTDERFYLLERIGKLEEFTRFMGKDESFASSLPTGVRHAIGSTYNFMAPLYSQILSSYLSGQNEIVELLQGKANDVIDALKELRVITGNNDALLTGVRYSMTYLYGVTSGIHMSEARLTEENTVNLRKSLDAIKPYMQN